MTTIKTLAAAIALSTATAAPALAQDYYNWGNISPWGLEMQDPYGNLYYVDPYAYDSQVDAYGNVISSYDTTLSPNMGYYDLTPTPGPSYTPPAVADVNPYAGRTDSHGKFLEMIWE